MNDARVQDFTISVAEILGSPGALRETHIERPLAGLQTALSRIPEGEPVRADVRLESVVEGVLVTGRATAGAAMTCARCLKALAGSLEAELMELYYAPGHRPADEDEAYEVTGEEVDLEPMLHDALTLALPLNPLCRADCRGLCPRCGTNWNERACDCADDEMDPRWAPLEALKKQLATNEAPRRQSGGTQA